MFVLSDGAASRATRSSRFIVSFVFCVPLINGTFEAAKVIECMDMSICNKMFLHRQEE